MSCGLEFFSTEVSAAPPKVIAHVPPNELYISMHITVMYLYCWSTNCIPADLATLHHNMLDVRQGQNKLENKVLRKINKAKKDNKQGENNTRQGSYVVFLPLLK
jgi:hypothetical protein